MPGIGNDDKVLLWGGGLYNWFDPRDAIRAVAELAETPHRRAPVLPGHQASAPRRARDGGRVESRALAGELGVLDRHVFFNESWVEYDERQNYLLEADAGVSTHFSHVETTFSFRTRILDYLWAELPMVVTEGDHFAELVEREKLGSSWCQQDVAHSPTALETHPVRRRS